MSKTILLRISKEDRERLEIICAAHGVSMSAAVRMAIRAITPRLGLEPPKENKP
jgi:antitoxin component of RelBE/YafQ-DinJ toxin-antitoxin module